MMQNRTHNCNELRLEHAGQSVKLCGWMENVREVGAGLAFVVLRDFYGTTQVVVETEEMMNVIKPLNKETTISVEGVVRERSSKTPSRQPAISKLFPSASKFSALASTTSSPSKSTAAARLTRCSV